jgi:argininosuccinate lyase
VKSKPSAPVWSKKQHDAAADANIRYCAGRDVVARPPADALLLEADLWTNRAHAVMLARRKILTAPQAAAILDALEAIRRRAAAGEFVIPPESEDVHMAIEQEVTRLAGPDSGGWLHAGRSRNDQTTCDVRLWLRQSLLGILDSARGLGEALTDHAARHAQTVCPGFTHMQPAMATTWGHIAGAWAQGLLRDLERLEAAYVLCNRSPLGAAASFGTSWPIDRETTAQLLGFDAVQENTLDCVSSRGEIETQAVAALAMLMNRLSGIGQDLILLSTPPRRWVRLDDRFVTGSSIMPQKRNPDFAEVTRAKAAAVAGIAAALLGIGRAAPAGYNRDSQWTKYLVMDAFAEAEGAAEIFAGVIGSLEVDARRMREACREGFLNAAEVAEALAAETRIPFRSCYRIVGDAVSRCPAAGELTRAIINGVLRAHWPVLRSEGIVSSSRPYQFPADLWRQLENPLGLIERREQTGSPKPARLTASIAGLRKALTGAQRRAAARRRALDRAQRLLDKSIAEILPGSTGIPG